MTDLQASDDCYISWVTAIHFSAREIKHNLRLDISRIATKSGTTRLTMQFLSKAALVIGFLWIQQIAAAPTSLAKRETSFSMYVFAQGGCNADNLLVDQSVTHTQDSSVISACFPVHNAGSIMMKVQGNCEITLRSGQDCKGESWAYQPEECVNRLFAGVFIACN